MAKKYLLYIHDELFDKEPHKSQLINNLLAKHYSNNGNLPSVAKEVPTIIKTKEDAEKIIKKPSTQTRRCKHGWPLGGCFDKKKDRSCNL